MSFEPILIRRNDGAIDIDVSNLREKREQNANKLNKLASDFSAYEQTDFSFVNFSKFLLCENPKEFLTDKYLKNNKIAGLNLKADKLESLLEIPPYEYILKQREFFKDWSKSEIKEYFNESKKTFVSVGVSNEEKEQVVKKHSFYITSETAFENYTKYSDFCEILNQMLTGGKLKQTHTISQIEQISTVLKRGESKSIHNKRIRTFEIKEELFTQTLD